VPLPQLIHAALIDYPRYVDPTTGTRCEIETLLAWIASQRLMANRPPPPARPRDAGVNPKTLVQTLSRLTARSKSPAGAKQ
jgi:capsule polysaccharide export protein KpsC/LpsZ